MRHILSDETEEGRVRSIFRTRYERIYVSPNNRFDVSDKLTIKLLRNIARSGSKLGNMEGQICQK